MSKSWRGNDEQITNFIFKTKKEAKKRCFQCVEALYFTKFFQKIKTEIFFVKITATFYAKYFLRFFRKLFFIKMDIFERTNNHPLGAVEGVFRCHSFIITLSCDYFCFFNYICI